MEKTKTKMVNFLIQFQLLGDIEPNLYKLVFTYHEILIFSPLVEIFAMALEVRASQIRTDLSPEAVACKTRIRMLLVTTTGFRNLYLNRRTKV